jgi:hypothetical protein
MKRTGSCPECGFDWEEAVGHLPEQLQSIPREFEEALAGCDETVVRTRTEALVWSPLEYAAHTRDVLAWFEGRIRRVLSEERPPQLAAVGWAAATEERRYHRETTSAIMSGVAHAATSLCDLLRSLSSEEWVRVGVGSEGDERDVAILARRAVHEAVHHLMDVRRQTAKPTVRERSQPPA